MRFAIQIAACALSSPDAAAVEVAVLLGERERIHAPVFALRFDDVGVREQQNGTTASGAAIPHDEIRLRRTRAADEDVGGGEAGRLEPLRDALRRPAWSRRSCSPDLISTISL